MMKQMMLGPTFYQIKLTTFLIWLLEKLLSARTGVNRSPDHTRPPGLSLPTSALMVCSVLNRSL